MRHKVVCLHGGRGELGVIRLSDICLWKCEAVGTDVDVRSPPQPLSNTRVNGGRSHQGRRRAQANTASIETSVKLGVVMTPDAHKVTCLEKSVLRGETSS